MATRERDPQEGQRGWTRRKFLAWAGRLGLGGAAAAVLGKMGWLRWRRASVHAPRVRRPGRVLTEHEFATLEALADLIVPSDDLGPGARDLDAARRVEDRLMRHSYELERYRKGLRWLDQAAAQVYGAGTFFVDLGREEQIALLEQIEATARKLRGGRGGVMGVAWRYWDRLMVTLFGFGAGVFFLNLVREDVLEAVYSHPRTWIALGYDGPPQPLGYWNGANGNWNIIDDCPPTKRHDFPPSVFISPASLGDHKGGEHG